MASLCTNEESRHSLPDQLQSYIDASSKISLLNIHAYYLYYYSLNSGHHVYTDY